MKQRASKSFFRLKWLAVLIVSFFMMGTFHSVAVNTVYAETTSDNSSKMVGSYETTVNVQANKNFNETITVPLKFNNPDYDSVKVPVQLNNLKEGNYKLQFFVFRENKKYKVDVFLLNKNNLSIHLEFIDIVDGKVVKPFQYDRATDKRDVEEMTTEAVNEKENQSNLQSTNQKNNDNNTKTNTYGSEKNSNTNDNKKISFLLNNLNLKDGEFYYVLGQALFFIVLILMVFVFIGKKQNKARNNSQKENSNMNMRSPKRNERRQNNTDSRLEDIPQRVYRPRHSISNPKQHSQAKKQATKQALQSTKHQRTQQSPEEFVGTQRPTRPVVYKTKSKEKSHTLPRVLSNKSLPRIIKTVRLK